MKKVLLIAAVAVLALASCKKEKTCTCTYTSSDGTSETEVYVIKGKMKHLKDECGTKIETISSTTNGENDSYENCELD